MRFLFRVDASLQIGAGHLMRCLTLANALSLRGAQCLFVTRQHPGNLNALIVRAGHALHSFSQPITIEPPAGPGRKMYQAWLGVSVEQDAEETAAIAERFAPNWIVEDHYALDDAWESCLSSPGRKLMAIDDLADRPHMCEILLDQTFGRQPGEYDLLVPPETRLFCGAEYALLRPEFSQWREHSLSRRDIPILKRVLISLGGMDQDNVTCEVLRALRSCPLPEECEIVIVVGETAPWREAVKTLAATLPWQTEVHVGVTEMAALMASCDLAIGAAGSSTWERCSLGLPSIMLVVADNQLNAAKILSQTGAVAGLLRAELDVALAPLIARCVKEPSWLKVMSERSRLITDGNGVERVVDYLMEAGRHE